MAESDKNQHYNKRTKRPLVLASIMLGMFLSAIEATIVSTAMPGIVADLGGFSLYSWVFSAYLLTNAATMLIFGKLSDIFGRKSIFIIGISLFIIGSILSGFSVSMKMLVGSRFVQGLGAGALMPVATTIVGDMYTREQRAKIQGYLSSVWGISAVTGPLLGGFFVDVLNWRYVFWMNIPLGLLAMAGIIIFLHEDIDRKKRSIDYLGTLLIFLAITAILVILVEVDVTKMLVSPSFWTMAIIAGVCFILFFWQERRAAAPVMPLEIWHNRLISVANLASLTTGMIIIAITSYLPTFVQGVMGKSATIAGFTLTTMSIGWPIASTIAGRLLLKIGYRKTSLLGGLSLIAGGVMFFLLTPDKGPLWAGAGSFFIGIGMGMTSTAFIVGIQSNVDWNMRGIATASNMFMRSLGSAVGVALFGGILNNHLNTAFNRAGVEGIASIDSINQLLEPNEMAKMSNTVQTVLKGTLSSGLHITFSSILILAFISVALIWFLPVDTTNSDE